MAKNTAIGKRTNHVDIQYWFVNDMVQQGDLLVAHIPGNQNPSDVMTKNLPYALHHKHTKTISDGLLGELCDPQNTGDVEPSRAIVVSADSTNGAVCPLSSPDNSQASTGTSCSDGSQINTCEDGYGT